MGTIKEIIDTGFNRQKRNNITFLTGAGMSSARGIPTHRGTVLDFLNTFQEEIE